MKKRKPNNGFARAERNCRALVRTNHVAVINLEPGDYQWMINWKSGKLITSRHIVDALLEISHRWTMYCAVLCTGSGGEQYMKSEEFATTTVYKVASLEELTQATIEKILATCNQNHRLNRGWIAIPDKVTMTREEASRLFAAVHGWRELKAA